MYKTNDEAIAITKGDKLFKMLLLFYPKQYEKRFGREMFFTFQDLYKEELEEHGGAGVKFWISIITDTIHSAFIQHMTIIKQQGVKQYFRINVYNTFGFFLLLPFIILLGFDFFGRLIQGNFTHYNRAWYFALSHTILYSTFNGKAYFLWILIVIAPLFALLLNLIPLVTSIKHMKKMDMKNIFLANPLAVVIVGISALVLLIVYGHDFFPCIINGLLNNHVNKENILSICKNA